MNTGRITLICFCLVIPMFLTGQQNHTIGFHNGDVPDAAYLKPAVVTPYMLEETAFNGRHYLLLQFEDVPDADQQQALAALDVQLLHYVPNYAWFASLPVSLSPSALPTCIKAVLLPKAIWKLSPELARQEAPLHAWTIAGLRVQILPYDDIAPATLADSLTAEGLGPVQVFPNKIELTIAEDNLKMLASFPGVLYIAPIDKAPVSEGITGRTAMRANGLYWGVNSPLIDGSGVYLAIADDGTVTHQDIKGRVFPYTSLNTGSHGEMTVGLAIGAGNIHPLGTGMAPGAGLHLYHISNYPHIAQAAANFLQRGVVITSTSYGEGCGGVYTAAARDLDMQALTLRHVLHIFSAGNSGLQACGIYGSLGYHYGAIYGNITGGRKASKHSIAVGNLYFNDSLRINSSRGPLNDGILKPELTAPGQGILSIGPDNTYQLAGGTSAAAPTVAGLAALLYQSFRLTYSGANPTFAHIKAVMMNTAEDLGRPGPDYEYGYGRPNGARALKAIQNQWFIEGNVAHQGINTHTVTVTPGTKQLRLMGYWFDPEATPNASKYLVNDLNISILTPSGEIILPWVLSTAAHIDSITRPAYRGTDRVNVMEQITIDAPQPGVYQVRIHGHLVPRGPQDYVISYFLEEQELAVTYPSGNEGWVPGETEVVRWDAFGQSGNFTLEVSTDSMATWQTIAAQIPAHIRYYEWTVPNTVTGRAFIRVRRGNHTATSAAPFNIIGLPDFQIRSDGEYMARVFWPRVPGANRYTVYAMGERYMEVLGQTADTVFTFPAQINQENWYSVQAGHSSGISSRRAVAKSYLHLPCQAGVQLTIKFDQFPGEIRWEIRNQNGGILSQGGPYTGLTPHATIAESVCLPFGCFQLIVYDGYNDGLCCQNGQGYYQLHTAGGTLLASGSQFTSSDTRQFCLNNPGSPLTASAFVQQHVSCYGGGNGIARVTAGQGSGTYYYTWSNGATSSVVGNLPPGVYTVTVTDGLSQVSSSVTITQPQPIDLMMDANPTSCSGSANGSVSASASGGMPPFSYVWNTGQSGPNVSGLPAGNYSVTATDSKGCTKTDLVMVTQPGALVLSATTSPASNGSNGSVQISAGGGVAPYQFLWSNGATTNSISGLSAGVYSVTVTDANACSASLSANVPAPADNLCASRGIDTNFEHIGSIQVGSLQNTSGNNGGYEDYTAMSTTMTGGTTYNVALQPVYAATNYTEYWRIWIDLNRDNLFDESTELVFSAAASGLVQGSFTLPANYTPGPARMRIAMKYGAHASPCGNFPYGEVEDYTVILAAPPAVSYCASQSASTVHEWIQGVQIGTMVNESGPNGGYADFTNMTIEAAAGGALQFALTPGYFNNFGGEHWRIWIDFNRDGDFYDPGEQIFSSNQSNTVIQGTMYLPASATPGPTRMRVTMRWNAYPGPCDEFAWGEVEDYTLVIASNLNGGENDQLRAPVGSEYSNFPAEKLALYPNPAGSQTTLHFYSENEAAAMLEVTDLTGKILNSRQVETAWGDNRWSLPLDGLSPGVYIIAVRTADKTYQEKLTVLHPAR